jgi:hypothetical protein
MKGPSFPAKSPDAIANDTPIAFARKVRMVYRKNMNMMLISKATVEDRKCIEPQTLFMQSC